jgi:hypothetical protein
MSVLLEDNAATDASVRSIRVPATACEAVLHVSH